MEMGIFFCIISSLKKLSLQNNTNKKTYFILTYLWDMSNKKLLYKELATILAVNG
ncbi:hypothetical protein GCM10023315_17820 [Algibacter aquimarinus]|uniref:Uncharacterized protein n=1 Tax=Algibacter aquimarinus TaxID=1136748 RepID=A0ABP9HDW7_9FLAO